MSEFIVHYTGIRCRVRGAGNLKLKLLSLSEVYDYDCVPLAMQTATNRRPTQLCNFNQERACIRIETTEKDEYFQISDITVFVKPIATGWPQ